MTHCHFKMAMPLYLGVSMCRLLEVCSLPTIPSFVLPDQSLHSCLYCLCNSFISQKTYMAYKSSCFVPGLASFWMKSFIKHQTSLIGSKSGSVVLTQQQGVFDHCPTLMIMFSKYCLPMIAWKMTCAVSWNHSSDVKLLRMFALWVGNQLVHSPEHQACHYPPELLLFHP